MFATKVNLKAEREASASKLMNETIFTTETRAEKILCTWKTSRSHKEIQPHKEEKVIFTI